MLKRLTKGRRHSADEAGLQSSKSQDEPPGLMGGLRRESEDTVGVPTTPTFVFAPRTKMTRKSCGDAYSLLSEEEPPPQTETDYRVVTAVPAFIVEHEPEKQRGLASWGLRRMSKKIDSFRRSGSRDSICTIPENNNGNPSDLDTANNNASDKKTRFFQNSHRSPSPFKSFFIRMGSTGMLNSSTSKSRRSSQNLEDKPNRTPDKENLFRSCSTSQLNTSPTYVKGDDPSEGIDLRINAKNEHGKTVSCDNLSGRQSEDDVFDNSQLNASSRSFTPCDFTDPSKGDFMRKSSSCDFKEAKKTNFPYAFLRSRLSVLPEERNYTTTNGGKEERLFKVASEEHFPAMKIEESFEGTTTLGRRRPKTGYLARESLRYRMSQDPNVSRSARNSYCEESRYEQKGGYFGTVNLAMMHSMEENCRNSISLPYQGSSDRQEILDYRQDTTSSLNLDLSYESNSTMSTTITPTSMMTSSLLRNHHRRNSAPSGEQRLSSHYVSSNESGYDSDGPRGESAEAMSLKCTDSSDTSSVVDSELEKPMRSSTPSEDQESKDKLNGYQDETESIDGLRWHHQSASGRLLPSIHQSTSSSSSSPSSSSSSSSSTNSMGAKTGLDPLGIQAAAHRVRLQQDKTRFLSDIIQPPKRVRRCRLVQLTKTDTKESLGIRLAQQRVGEIRYVIVQLEIDGIAHRDGRLRLGDEIVEVEGKDLRSLSSLEEVQDFLRSCEGLTVHLKTAYEESVPELYASESNTEEYLQESSEPKSIVETKRPDYLALDTIGTSSEAVATPQQHTTRHVARFEKGLGKPSLGFSVVGGVDSPRGEMGIFVRRVFPGGQADVSKALFQGDEILSLNGKVLRGCTHQEVIELFKGVREGVVELELVRRHRYQKAPLKTAPY